MSFHSFRSRFPQRSLRWALLCLVSGVFALAALLDAGTAVFAQAKKAAPKSADKGAAKDSKDVEFTVDDDEVSLQERLIGDAVADADSPQYRKVTAAIDKFQERRVKEARDLLIEAQTTHRQLPPAEVLVAKLFILARQPQLAMAELEQAVRRHPRDPEAYLILADGSLAEERITAAEVLYQKADALVKAFDENAKRKENFEKRVLNGLAAVALGRQQWTTAESLLRQMIKLDPKNAGALQRLGQALFQQGKWKESFNMFASAVQVDPKAVKPDVALGQLFEQAAQEALAADDNAKFKEYRGQATDAFRRATAQKPDLATLLAAASWALQTNQSRIAEQHANAAMKLDPDSLEARLVAGVVARFSGDLATAERLLNESFNASPSNFAVSNQLALVLADTRDPKKQNRALELANLNARMNQSNAEAAATLGWVLYQLGRKAEGQQVLDKVIKSGAVTADSAYYVARMLSDQDRNAQAVQILQDALAKPQPFANRTNAANLLTELRKTVESGDSKDDGKRTPTSTRGRK